MEGERGGGEGSDGYLLPLACPAEESERREMAVFGARSRRGAPVLGKHLPAKLINTLACFLFLTHSIRQDMWDDSEAG